MITTRSLTLLWPGLPWLWLRGSVAGAFLMGAGGHVRWANDSALWASLSAVVEGVRANQQADGFAMAFAQQGRHRGESVRRRLSSRTRVGARAAFNTLCAGALVR